MRFSKNSFVALLLLGILFLPVYGWIVQVVNGFGLKNMVGSFRLESSKKPGFSDVFEVGDTLIASADSVRADTYELTIYDNSSVVLVERGLFSDASARVPVPLSPPTFSAGNMYIAVLDVHTFNDPLPGAYFSDSVNLVFEVVDVATKLGFEAQYDGAIGGLYLNANLTDISGYPVGNETVDFSLQFANRRRLTEGWVPLGSANTDTNGNAKLNLGFGLAMGNYSLKAYHKGNENFSESKNVTDVEIFSNSTIGGLASDLNFDYDYSDMAIDPGGDAGLNLRVSNSTPYALLPLSVKARYVTDTYFGGLVFIVFFVDYMNTTGVLNAVFLDSAEGPPYIYEGSLVWSPDVIGSHEIIAGIGHGNMTDVARATQGIGLITSKPVGINILRCPSNVVVDYPAVAYGNVLPVSVAVSKPRPYEVGSTDSYVTATLAPQLLYGGSNYTIDEGVGLVVVELYLNDAPAAESLTDEYGLASFSLPLNFTSASLRAVVDDDPSMLQAAVVEESLSFRKVRVYDLPFNGTSCFNLNFTAGKLDEAGNMYVQVETPLEIKASFLNEPVWNLPVTVVGGKLISSFQTDASGTANITGGADFLRVQGVTLFHGDANWDGRVNSLDSGTINSAWGSYPGHPRWNVDADLNHDNRVNSLELGVLNANWGKIRGYAIFNTGQQVNLDSQGVARIPPNATSVTIYRDGKTTGVSSVEFFRTDFNMTSETDELGEVVEVWAPSEVGTYLVQVKLAERFDVFSSSNTSLTGLDASVNLVNYFEVVKRPVSLAFSYSPSNVTVGSPVDLIVDAADGVIGGPVPNLPIQFRANGEFVGTAPTNLTGTAVLSWTPQSHVVYEVFAASLENPMYKASNASFTFDLRYSTELGLWLEESTTVLFCSEPSLDGYMYRKNAYYPPLNLYGPFTTDPWFAVGQMKIAPYGHVSYYVYRGYFSFDTSTLPEKAYVRSAALRLKCRLDQTSGSDFVVQVTGGSQPIYGPSLDAADWGAGTALAGQWNTANYVDQAYISIAIDASQINLTGRTQFELRSSREGTQPSGYELVDFYSAHSTGNEPYLEVTYDYPAEEIADNGTVNVDTLVDNRFYVEGLPVSGSDETVNIYLNGSLYDTEVSRTGDTVFTWNTESPGTCFFNVSYAGTQTYKPDNFNFAALVEASPVSLNFTVNPTEFEMGATVNLWAKAINPLTLEPFDDVWIEFWQDGYGSGILVNQSRTRPDGVATSTWTYPTNGVAHTIVAKVKEGVALATVPVTLTVGVATELWLWIRRGSSSMDHTVYVRLVRANSTVSISNVAVRLDVNGAAYTLTTNETGFGEKALKLEAVGGQATTYHVTAMFNGTNPQTRNLTVTDPTGQDYAACTTLQYDYKPSFNTATLTVEAPKTDVQVDDVKILPGGVRRAMQMEYEAEAERSTVTVSPPKTPQQIQAEAEQSGWLQIWPEFSWSYPWFRLHIKISINPTIEIAFNPVLPGGELWSWTGLEFFAGITQSVMEEILIDIPTIFIQYLVATGLSLWDPAAGVIAEFLKFGVQMGLLVWREWNDKLGLVASALVSVVMGLVALKVDISVRFINAILGFIPAPAGRILTILNNKLVFMLITTGLFIQTRWLNVLEMILDFITSGFAVARYVGWI